MDVDNNQIQTIENNHNKTSRTTIAPEVLITISRLTTLNVPGVSRMSSVPGGVNRFFLSSSSEGVRLRVHEDTVTADLYVILKNGFNIGEVSRIIQYQVSRAITEMVGMNVGKVNIHVEDIDYSNIEEA